MTKRDKPAMSEEEFEKAIKELAQKEFATGKRDDAAYRKLCMQHGETVSPDRKAIYESSMRKTGGKMNAACMFWDNNGNKTLSYNPESRNWKAISTEEEFARARVFTSIYNDELARLKKEYGENAKGTRATLNARGAVIEINNINYIKEVIAWVLILYYEVIFLFKQKILQKELHQVQQMLIKHRGYQSQKNWKILKKRFGKK